MTNLLSTEPSAPIAAEQAETPEFEIVLGRRQMASLGLVGAILLAVFSGLFYVIGKSASPRPVVVQSWETVPPPPPVAETPAPAPAAAPAAAAATTAAPADPPDAAPLFAEPQKGALYLQMGAVEKGVAQVWAEGLRTHHLNAFVASGPNEKIFRVLIGPLAGADAYRQAKQTVEDLGLSTFAKRIQP